MKNFILFLWTVSVTLLVNTSSGQKIYIEISPSEIFRDMPFQHKDSLFLLALADASARFKVDKIDFIPIFCASYSRISNHRFSYLFDDTQDNLDDNMFIRASKLGLSRKTAYMYDLIRQRMHVAGYDTVGMTLDTSRGIVAAGLSNRKIGPLRSILSAKAKVGFWSTYENKEVVSAVLSADSILGEQQFKKTKDSSSYHPILSKLSLLIREDGTFYSSSGLGMARGNDTALLSHYLYQVRDLLPKNLLLVWSMKSFGGEDIFILHTLKCETNNKSPVIDEQSFTAVRSGYTKEGGPDLTFELDKCASLKFQVMTDSAANSVVMGELVHKDIAITLNGRVYSAPRVLQKIPGSLLTIHKLDPDESMKMEALLNISRLMSLPNAIRLK